MVKVEWRRGSDVASSMTCESLNEALKLIFMASSNNFAFTVGARPYVNGEPLDLSMHQPPPQPPQPPPVTAAPAAADPAIPYLKALAAINAARPQFPWPLELISTALGHVEKMDDGDER